MQGAAPRRVLHAEEHAPVVDGIGLVKNVHVGVEQFLRVLVEADAGVVHLRSKERRCMHEQALAEVSSSSMTLRP